MNSSKMRSVVLIALVGVLLLGPRHSQACDASKTNGPPQVSHSSAPPPKGWKIYSSSRPPDILLYCVRYGADWEVSLKDDEVVIKQPAPWIAWKMNPQTMPFRGGMLRAEYHGEYFSKSSLWWSSSDGSISKKLLDGYVVGFADSSVGTLVFTNGQVFRIDSEGELPPTHKVLATFAGDHVQFAKDPSGDFIVATSAWIYRFKPPGTLEKLLPVDYEDTFLNSTVVTSSGTVYAGMRHFVTRLTPVDDKYQEDWLIPEKSKECPVPECRTNAFPDCKCLKKSDYEIQNNLTK
jgi:hypothetical protein